MFGHSLRGCSRESQEHALEVNKKIRQKSFHVLCILSNLLVFVLFFESVVLTFELLPCS